ncbi:MAG: hypothetical protein U9Q85_03665 [Patescibacteria group bacterium]|nr:hypothetical protein [Patescibacteria group bacterium]
MMFNIAPLIIILLSLGVIIIIVLRKFAILANLDVDSIPAEREAKIKEKIISSRLKRIYFKHFNQLSRLITPIGKWTGEFLKDLYAKLLELRDNYKKEEEQASGEGVVDKLFLDAGELIKEEKWEEAEKKYIEIIEIDSVNIKAFKELGRMYYERKDYNEAKQTILHALKLVGKESVYEQSKDENEEKTEDNNLRIAELYFDLTLVNKAVELYEEAIKSIDNALRLGKNNPRYLDTKIEISIINKNKISALNALEKLKKVNPENHKLAEFKEQVDKL